MNPRLSLLVLVLAACNKDAPPPSAPTDATATATATASPPPPASTTAAPTPDAPPTGGRARAKEGQMCGGIAGIMCEEGLNCVMPGPTHPDQSGTCKK
jgi:hypothetical protein